MDNILYNENLKENVVDQVRVYQNEKLDKLFNKIPELNMFVTNKSLAEVSLDELNYICRELYEIGSFNKLIKISLGKKMKKKINPYYNAAGTLGTLGIRNVPQFNETEVDMFTAIIIVDDPVIVRRMDMKNKLKR